MLQNINASKSGDEEVSDGFELTLGKPAEPIADPYQREVWNYQGIARLRVGLFYAIGQKDWDGREVMTRGADGMFAGSWHADTGDLSPRMGLVKMAFPCKTVTKIEMQAPAVVCGQDGIPSEVLVECEPQQGNSSLPCRVTFNVEYQNVTFLRLP